MTHRADHGTNGGDAQKLGRKGKDLIIEVPLGTVVSQITTYDNDYDALKTNLNANISRDLTTKTPRKSSNSSSGNREQISSSTSTSTSYHSHSQSEIESENESETETDFESDSDIDSIRIKRARKKLNCNVNSDIDNRMTLSNRNRKEEYRNIKEFLTPGDTMIVASGGKGGRGNINLKSKFRNHHPRWSEMGIRGEQVLLELELKCIADVGLVGYPNAGKSSLLTAVSRSKPAISNQPFTTLNPHIGIINLYNSKRQTVFKMSFADIPGIIDGASENKGLGLEFLRHIERCKVLVYVIDVMGNETNGTKLNQSNVNDSDSEYSSSSSCTPARTPINDFISLRNELKNYNPSLLERPSILFCNKYDLVNEFETYKEQFHQKYQNKQELDGQVQEIVNQLKNIVNGMQQDQSNLYASGGIVDECTGLKMSNFGIILGSAAQNEFGNLLPLCKELIEQVRGNETKQQERQSFVQSVLCYFLCPFLFFEISRNFWFFCVCEKNNKNEIK